MQLLFHLVYYHSTCFGHGSCPSSGVVYKTVEASTSVCQCVWGGMCTLNQGRVSMRMMLRIGPPTRIDTHWWLPLQFCILLLKMDTNRVRNM